MSRQPIDIRDANQLHSVIGGALHELEQQGAAIDGMLAKMAQENAPIAPEFVMLRASLRAQAATLLALAGVVQATVHLVQPAANVVPLIRRS